MLRYIYIFCFFIIGVGLKTQTTEPHLEEVTSDTMSLAYMQQLIHSYYYQGDFKEGLALAEIYFHNVESVSLDSQLVHKVPAYSLVALFNDLLGNTDEALSYYRQARDIAKELLGEDDIEYIVQMNNIGLIYKRMLRYEKALPYYKTAFDYYKRQATLDTANYLVTAKNYAELLIQLNREEEGFALWDEIIPLSRVYGPVSMNHANTLYAVAVFLKEADKIENVTPYFQESARIIKEVTGGNHPAYAMVLGRLAASYYDGGNVDSAIVITRQALALAGQKYDAGNDHIYHPLIQLASYLEEADSLMASNSCWLQASAHINIKIKKLFPSLNELEQNGLLDDVNFVFNHLQSYTIRHPEQTIIIKENYNNQLIYKRLLLNNKRRLMARLSESIDPSIQQQYQDWLRLNEEIGQQLSFPKSNQSNQLDSLVDRAEELESTLAHQSKYFNDQRNTLGWKDIQAHLKERAIALEFSSFSYRDVSGKQDEIYNVVYSIDKASTAPQMTILFKENELPNLNATRQIYRYNTDENVNNLHQLIYQPLAKILADKTTVYYALDGSFQKINLQAIPVDANGNMHDYFEMHRLSSTGVISLKKQKKNLPPTSALVFGGIDYDAKMAIGQINETPDPSGKNTDASMAQVWRDLGGGDWNYLNWTKIEAKETRQLLIDQKVDVLLKIGAEATEEIFKKEVGQLTAPAIIHLATHGYFFPVDMEGKDLSFANAENPLIRSGLILSKANFAWNGGIVKDTEEDGILTAYEIAQMNLEGVELVVLSACDTGLGDIKNGEGVYGLQRAFKLAGVRYVLMSIFKVSDHQAQEFMNLFYTEYLVNKKDIPLAFQSAQKQLRDRYAKPFNPSLWAGFILME